MKILKNILFGVLAVFIFYVVLGIIFDNAIEDKPKVETPKEEVKKEVPTKDNTVDAITMLSLYSNNEVKADSYFKNSRFFVTGTVEKVGKDIGDDVYITLEGMPTNFRQVQCFTVDTDLNKVSNLTPGQPIVILGTCTGMFGNIIMKNCEIYE